VRKIKQTQVHFWILENLWRQFLEIFSGLGYSTKSEFFRDTVRRALQEASKIEGHHQVGIRVAEKCDAQRLKFGSEKDLGQGEQNAAKTLKGKVVEVHFNIPEELWRRFLAVLPALGYSSASEFFRAKIREAISIIGTRLSKGGFQLLGAKEKAKIVKRLRKLENNRSSISEGTKNEQPAQQSSGVNHDKCGYSRSTEKVKRQSKQF